MTSRPSVWIVQAPGTNRAREAAWACERAGGASEIVPLAALLEGARTLDRCRFLVLPGGFSYGDALGAGRVWASVLRHRLGEALEAFVASGRPVLGICNGFQALVQAGLVPGGRDGGVWSARRDAEVTLTENAPGGFVCRWVRLEPEPSSPCVFTQGLSAPIWCPAAHGEGRVRARDAEALARLEARGAVALRYSSPDGGDAVWPWNPNGSDRGIAALCNAQGNVMGLMPHPEDHIEHAQHPRAHEGVRGGLGLALFEQGVRYAARL